MRGLADALFPLRREPVFWVVLALKVGASLFFASTYLRDLFLPFITHFIDSGFQNPFEHFAAHGALNAFPYSGTMLGLLSLPQALVSVVAPGLVHGSEPLRLFLIRLPMLAADLAILAVLIRWFETKPRRILWIYWCSPILFFISYVHGQIDSIPSAFLLLSLWALFRGRGALAGVLLGLGIGAKLHLLVAVPFLAVFLWRGAAGAERTRRVARFALGLLGAVALTVGPLLPSAGFRRMVLGTSEASRLFDVALPVSGTLFIYVAPAALFLLLLRFAAAPRINRDLAASFLAVVFSVLVVLVPPMPGWYFWAIPFAAYFFIQKERVSTLPFWLVGGLYVLYYGLFWTDPATGRRALGLDWPAPVGGADPESVVFTALQAAVALMAFWIYRLGVRSSREYVRGGEPVLIGIGGDSASGKHTLATALRDLVGPALATQTEGDDYHRWPRGDAAWQRHTHLDPHANEMGRAAADLWSLRHGRAILKRRYDHTTGQFGEPTTIEPRRLVFFVGLHPFFLRRMRHAFDLRIYLDPAEGLRRHWKILRDQALRGYDRAAVEAQIAARRPDGERFVHPQRRFADWVVEWTTPTDEPPADARAAPVHARHVLANDLPVEPLVDELRKLPDVTVRWDLHADMERQVVEVLGQPQAPALRAIAYRLFPQLGDLLGTDELTWCDGALGVCQLLFVVLLDDALRTRSGAASDM